MLDNGVIINRSFLLRENRLAIEFMARKIVIIQTNMFVGKKLKPMKTSVCCRKTKLINTRTIAFTALTIRNFLGKTL